MKKISIAMTTYNGEKYVLKQLKSLLVQSRKADEVIIFDDISTDNTPLIVRNFIKKNNLNDTWKFVINEENLGFIKNFAKALKHTTGDIIFLCDQDDIWHKDKIKIVENLFESNYNITTICGTYIIIDENDNIRKVPRNIELLENTKLPAKLEKVNRKKLITRNIGPGCAMTFTKEIKELYLSTSDFKLSHDYEINILTTLYGELYTYSKPLLKYRVHNNNTVGLQLNPLKIKFNTNIEVKKTKTKERLQELLYEYSVIENNTIDIELLKELNLNSCFYNTRLEFVEKKSLLLWFKYLRYALQLRDRYFVTYTIEDLIWLIKGLFKLNK